MSVGTSTGAGGVAEPGGGAEPEVTQNTRARQAAILQIAKEGSPAQVTEFLVRLVDSGDIVLNSEPGEEEEFADANPLEMDSEMPLGDEDNITADSWGGGRGDYQEDGPFSGDDADTSLDTEDTFAILVSDEGLCTVPANDWSLYRPLTSHGSKALEELGKRHLALCALASWLSSERKQFLISRDTWDLGVNAFKEAEEGVIPVLQNSLVSQLGLKVDASSFSRYTQSTSLVWRDGAGSLSVLFNKDAKLAWAANAVVQFVNSQGESLNSDQLAQSKDITAPKVKGKKTARSSKTVSDMDFNEYIGYVIMLADIKWSDVVDRYASKMCDE